MTVDIDGYERLMEEAKRIGPRGRKGRGFVADRLPPDALARTCSKRKVQPTDDQAKYLGDPIRATVKAIWNGTELGRRPRSRRRQRELAVILDQTNFYAEMGGQVGDTGELDASAIGRLFVVETTRSVGGYVLHIGRLSTAATRGRRRSHRHSRSSAAHRTRKKPHHHPPRQLGPARSPRRRRAAERARSSIPKNSASTSRTARP